MIPAAILALETHKPLANVAAHGVLAFSPFLVPFLGFENVNDYSRLLRKRENFERLLVLLEETEQGEPTEAPKEEVKERQS